MRMRTQRWQSVTASGAFLPSCFLRVARLCNGGWVRSRRRNSKKWCEPIPEPNAQTAHMSAQTNVLRKSSPIATPPTEKSIERTRNLVTSYTNNAGTCTHPNHDATEGVVLGLALHLDEYKRPLCPCRFYPDKAEEIKH